MDPQERIIEIKNDEIAELEETVKGYHEANRQLKLLVIDLETKLKNAEYQLKEIA